MVLLAFAVQYRTVQYLPHGTVQYSTVLYCIACTVEWKDSSLIGGDPIRQRPFFAFTLLIFSSLRINFTERRAVILA